MAMDCGTEIEGGKEKSGTSTTGVSNEDESSAVEAHKLLIDYLQHEIEFQETGQEKGLSTMMTIVLQGPIQICQHWWDD